MTSRARSPRFRPCAAAVLLALGITACVPDRAANAPLTPARPRPIRPSAPPGLPPTELDLIAGRYAHDSDKNGFADQIDVTVYLFNPAEFSGTLPTPGAFEFLLRTPAPELRTIAEWAFDPAAAREALRNQLPGPGYVFKLSLRDGGRGDELPAIDAVLTCRFTPDLPVDAGPRTIESRGPIRISIGKTR